MNTMPDLGFQLSSIAPFLDTIEHLKESLARIAAIGYRFVQLQGVSPSISHGSIAAALRENNLKCIATQEDYSFGFDKSPDRAIERAIACGSRYLVFSLIPPEFDTPDRLKGFAKKLSIAYEKIQKAGLILPIIPLEMTSGLWVKFLFMSVCYLFCPKQFSSPSAYTGPLEKSLTPKY